MHHHISDLKLSICCDEDCKGRLETHELVPGGEVIFVTAKTGTVLISVIDLILRHNDSLTCFYTVS